MAGMKIMFAFGHSILNKEKFFYYLKELHYRLLVLITVVLIPSFSEKNKIAQQNLPIHSSERLPQTVPQVLDSSSKLNLQFGRFFITEEEFNLRLNAIRFQFWKIQAFAKFVKDNHQKIYYTVFTDVFRFFVYVFNKGICRPQGYVSKNMPSAPVSIFDYVQFLQGVKK